MKNPSILAASSMICKPKHDLRQDPNYFLRKRIDFRIRLAICRGLYKIQKFVMEAKA